jgi:hypothetical protein
MDGCSSDLDCICARDQTALVDVPVQGQKGLVSFDPCSYSRRTYVYIGAGIPQAGSMWRSVADKYRPLKASRSFGNGVENIFKCRASLEELVNVIDRFKSAAS